ncbi:hypothetical protein [uncultured Butyricimonas sp.]|nr:hypothetical protein [uncultured Butyricimonas sp.]
MTKVKRHTPRYNYSIPFAASTDPLTLSTDRTIRFRGALPTLVKFNSNH